LWQNNSSPKELFGILSDSRVPLDKLWLEYVYNHNMHDVVVYPRKDCHLCEVVKQTLTNAQSKADFQWSQVDIDSDPELQRKYSDEVPVVFIDGRKAFKYRMNMHDFLRLLTARE